MFRLMNKEPSSGLQSTGQTFLYTTHDSFYVVLVYGWDRSVQYIWYLVRQMAPLSLWAETCCFKILQHTNSLMFFWPCIIVQTCFKLPT